MRCLVYLEALHPIERNVEAFLALRRTPSHLAFFPIVGVPLDLVPAAGARVDWEAVASDERVRPRVDGNVILATCFDADAGPSIAPERIVQVARALDAAGARTSLGSTCQTDYSRPIDALAATLLRASP